MLLASKSYVALILMNFYGLFWTKDSIVDELVGSRTWDFQYMYLKHKLCALDNEH